MIVATVGPFVRFGDPAVRGGDRRRRPLHRLDRRAGVHPAGLRALRARGRARGRRALTAFGYDWVPGNLAGALALRDAGEAATRVDIGYFTTGGLGGMSGGTRASAAGAMLEPAFVWRSGIRTERGAIRRRGLRRRRARRREAISVGSSEHFALPRVPPGPARGERLPRLVLASARGRCRRSPRSNAAILRVPGAKSGLERLIERFVPTSTGGPDEAARAGDGLVRSPRSPTTPAARELARVEVARRERLHVHRRRPGLGRRPPRSRDGMEAAGALGPATAFGLDRLEAGCAEAGIARVDWSRPAGPPATPSYPLTVVRATPAPCRPKREEPWP